MNSSVVEWETTHATLVSTVISRRWLTMNSSVATVALAALVGCAATPHYVDDACMDIYTGLSERFDSEFHAAQKENWLVREDLTDDLRTIDEEDGTSDLACAKRDWLREQMALKGCQFRLPPCPVEGI